MKPSVVVVEGQVEWKFVCAGVHMLRMCACIQQLVQGCCLRRRVHVQVVRFVMACGGLPRFTRSSFLFVCIQRSDAIAIPPVSKPVIDLAIGKPCFAARAFQLTRIALRL